MQRITQSGGSIRVSVCAETDHVDRRSIIHHHDVVFVWLESGFVERQPLRFTWQRTHSGDLPVNG